MTKVMTIKKTPTGFSDPQKHLDLLHKLIHLAAKDVVDFNSWNEDTQEHDEDSHPEVNMNDTFAFATADSESLREYELDTVADLHEKFGFRGLDAWAALNRGCDVHPKYRDDDYFKAKEYLQTRPAAPADPVTEVQTPPSADQLKEIQLLHRLISLSAFSGTVSFKSSDESKHQDPRFMRLLNGTVVCAVWGVAWFEESEIDILDYLKRHYGYAGEAAWIDHTQRYQIAESWKDAEGYHKAKQYLEGLDAARS